MKRPELHIEYELDVELSFVMPRDPNGNPRVIVYAGTYDIVWIDEPASCSLDLCECEECKRERERE